MKKGNDSLFWFKTRFYSSLHFLHMLSPHNWIIVYNWCNILEIKVQHSRWTIIVWTIINAVVRKCEKTRKIIKKISISILKLRMILTFLLKHHLFKGYYADPELECQAYHVCLQVGNIWFGFFMVYGLIDLI